MGTCCTACNEEGSVHNKPLTKTKVVALKRGDVKKKPMVQAKVSKVMDEYAAGNLKSSSGKTVDNPKQALAIGYSEARRAKKKS